MLIDGRSGSGKTELAMAFIAAHPRWQLVSLDELYPGWGGLEAGSAAVPELLESRRYRRWDWAGSRPSDWVTLDETRPILIEGCGALSRANRGLATSGVWVSLDAGSRRERATTRDAGAYDDHWEEWARQEEAFIARENPAALADLVVDGGEPIARTLSSFARLSARVVE